MKIKLLRKRENFLQIFQESSLAFFKQKYPNTSLPKVNYLINDHLNIVYPLHIDRNDLSNLVSEFKYHRNPFRRILQSIYVYLAIRKPFEFIASSSAVSISIPCNIGNQWIFIPGNHSIRVIDLERGRCFVFLKNGFNEKFIESDANVRASYPWLKAPKILHRGLGWYEEQRVIGLPLNRLLSNSLKEKIIDKARSQLSLLYLNSAEVVPANSYVAKICNKALILLEDSFPLVANRDKNVVRGFIDNIELLFNNSFSDERVYLACTHGDFHPGNILCSDDDFWIIDWEYADQRSIFYDALVFDLECRSLPGLSERFDEKVSQIYNSSTYLQWTGMALNKENRYYLLIFFIEDLLLRLNEVLADPVSEKFSALSIYSGQLEKIMATLDSSLEI